GHRRRVSPHIARIAVRKVQRKEVRLLFDTSNPHQGLAKVGLSVARWMRKRHEHLLTAPLPIPIPIPIPIPNIVLDDRVTANKPAFLAKPVKYPLRSMPLLARHSPVRLQPAIDDRQERGELRP